MKKIVLLIAILVLTAVAFWWARSGTAVAEDAPTLTAYLTDDGLEGFAQATEPGAITFPRDLGAHDAFQTEWWYYTGNLATADGRNFGYQFTIFRRAIAPPTELETVADASSFRTNQIYFAHFTISDIANSEFYAFEKFSRGAADLAGATAEPYHVWIEEWEVQEGADGNVRLQAVAEGIALDLVLTQTRPPVLHGQAGLSQKGSTEGNASYYYSLVAQASRGTVAIGEEVFEVTGQSWKDHEYSTSALEEGAVGWDWFSLTLDNAAENALMLFQIRRADGSLQAQSGGSWIAADSSVTPIALADFEIEVLDTWTSPTSGAEYPAAWRIRLPTIGLEMTGRPLMANQELNVSTTYWEGAVRFEGTLGDEAVVALGYVEMTGYSGELDGRR